MKIVIAFDSFKGCLTAEEAVEAARKGVAETMPGAEVVCLPLADGGEGTTAALCRFIDAGPRRCVVHDPLFRSIEACYAISRDGSTAVMEMAAAAGLTLLGEDERNPMKTSTFGVGEMLLDAAGQGCRRVVMGIGGSATNDGGTGMLAALGVRFFDRAMRLLEPVGGNLSEIAHIDWTGLADLGGMAIDVVCDVANPLCGNDGAAHVFARQKGAGTNDIERLESGLRHFSEVAGRSGDVPGCGAAGGLGYGLMLLGATLRRGVDVVLDAADIDRHLSQATLVLTGEGRIDRQTLCGKLPCGVLQRARQLGVPVVAMAGAVEDRELLLQAGFSNVAAITPETMSHAEAMQPATAVSNLQQAVAKLLKNP